MRVSILSKSISTTSCTPELLICLTGSFGCLASFDLPSSPQSSRRLPRKARLVPRGEQAPTRKAIRRQCGVSWEAKAVEDQQQEADL